MESYAAPPRVPELPLSSSVFTASATRLQSSIPDDSPQALHQTQLQLASQRQLVEALKVQVKTLEEGLKLAEKDRKEAITRYFHTLSFVSDLSSLSVL